MTCAIIKGLNIVHFGNTAAFWSCIDLVLKALLFSSSVLEQTPSGAQLNFRVSWCYSGELEGWPSTVRRAPCVLECRLDERGNQSFENLFVIVLVHRYSIRKPVLYNYTQLKQHCLELALSSVLHSVTHVIWSGLLSLDI